MFLALLSQNLIEEEVPDAQGNTSERTVLKLPPALAPVKCAVLPLLKNKDELTDMAQKVFEKIKIHFPTQYDEKDAIGRRYRRQDAIGTPFCVTVDFESLEDGTVTIRDRDSLEQDRISVDEIVERVNKKSKIESLLAQM
jgi:glycyl-tRNA synthetase